MSDEDKANRRRSTGRALVDLVYGMVGRRGAQISSAEKHETEAEATVGACVPPRKPSLNADQDMGAGVARSRSQRRRTPRTLQEATRAARVALGGESPKDAPAAAVKSGRGKGRGQGMEVDREADVCGNNEAEGGDTLRGAGGRGRGRRGAEKDRAKGKGKDRIPTRTEGAGVDDDDVDVYTFTQEEALDQILYNGKSVMSMLCAEMRTALTNLGLAPAGKRDELRVRLGLKLCSDLETDAAGAAAMKGFAVLGIPDPGDSKSAKPSDRDTRHKIRRSFGAAALLPKGPDTKNNPILIPSSDDEDSTAPEGAEDPSSGEVLQPLVARKRGTQKSTNSVTDAESSVNAPAAALPAVPHSGMTVAQLRKQAKQLGLKPEGTKKADLLACLLEHANSMEEGEEGEEEEDEKEDSENEDETESAEMKVEGVRVLDMTVVTLRKHAGDMGLKTKGKLKAELQQCVCDALRGDRAKKGARYPKPPAGNALAAQKCTTIVAKDGAASEHNARTQCRSERPRRGRTGQAEKIHDPLPQDLSPDRIRYHDTLVSEMDPEDRRKSLHDLDVAYLRKDDDEVEEDLVNALVLRKREAASRNSSDQKWGSRFVHVMRKSELIHALGEVADELGEMDPDTSGRVVDLRQRLRKQLWKWASTEIEFSSSAAGSNGAAAATVDIDADESEADADTDQDAEPKVLSPRGRGRGRMVRRAGVTAAGTSVRRGRSKAGAGSATDGGSLAYAGRLRRGAATSGDGHDGQTTEIPQETSTRQTRAQDKAAKGKGKGKDKDKDGARGTARRSPVRSTAARVPARSKRSSARNKIASAGGSAGGDGDGDDDDNGDGDDYSRGYDDEDSREPKSGKVPVKVPPYVSPKKPSKSVGSPSPAMAPRAGTRRPIDHSSSGDDDGPGESSNEQPSDDENKRRPSKETATASPHRGEKRGDPRLTSPDVPPTRRAMDELHQDDGEAPPGSGGAAGRDTHSGASPAGDKDPSSGGKGHGSGDGGQGSGDGADAEGGSGGEGAGGDESDDEGGGRDEQGGGDAQGNDEQDEDGEEEAEAEAATEEADDDAAADGVEPGAGEGGDGDAPEAQGDVLEPQEGGPAAQGYVLEPQEGAIEAQRDDAEVQGDAAEPQWDAAEAEDVLQPSNFGSDAPEESPALISQESFATMYGGPDVESEMLEAMDVENDAVGNEGDEMEVVAPVAVGGEQADEPLGLDDAGAANPAPPLEQDADIVHAPYTTQDASLVAQDEGVDDQGVASGDNNDVVHQHDALAATVDGPVESVSGVPEGDTIDDGDGAGIDASGGEESAAHVPTGAPDGDVIGDLPGNGSEGGEVEQEEEDQGEQEEGPVTDNSEHEVGVKNWAFAFLSCVGDRGDNSWS